MNFFILSWDSSSGWCIYKKWGIKANKKKREQRKKMAPSSSSSPSKSPVPSLHPSLHFTPVSLTQISILCFSIKNAGIKRTHKTQICFVCLALWTKSMFFFFYYFKNLSCSCLFSWERYVQTIFFGSMKKVGRNCSDNFIVKSFHHFDLNDSIRTSYRVTWGLFKSKDSIFSLAYIHWLY